MVRPTPRAPAKNSYLALVAAEHEVQELERQQAQFVQLQSAVRCLRSRAQALRTAAANREEALKGLIQERQAELQQLREQPCVEAPQPLADADPTDLPLGDVFSLALQDLKTGALNLMPEDGPSAWPELEASADLQLAEAELASALLVRQKGGEAWKWDPGTFLHKPFGGAKSYDSLRPARRLARRAKKKLRRMLALCPPPWANDCVMQQLPDVIAAREVFRDHIFPLSLMVTLRLYQSVFRFESKGLQSFQRAAEHLELLAKLNCHLGYQRCWQGRRLAWRRGVGALCRALGKLRADSSLKLDRGTPRLCARLMQERGVKRASELELLLGLMEGVQVLAALLPAQSLPEFTSGSIREAQLQHGADCQEALEALELDKRRALAELPNLLAVPRATELLMRRTLGLLERLDRFAHSFPGEVRSMPFELLYPARLSPDGVCHAQRLPSILPPEQRWFRSNVDGTRYYGPWPSVGELLLRYAAAGGSLSRWVLNLGSGDGGCVRGDEYDPANCLALEGFRTVAVEADAALAAQAAARLAEGAAKARVKAEAVEPQTVGAELSREALLLLAEGSIPPGADWLHLAETARRPDLLKVDIDHADCEVLGALLQAWGPQKWEDMDRR
ncbi:unnamed protein product [Effrenium voratum]|nr:unnamed protein product [Effrenium voratum]